MKDEVRHPAGHMVHYGAPIEQAIRITGAKVIPVGQSTYASVPPSCRQINDRTAAAVYVVSHHAVQYGQIELAEFCAVCHAQGVPVIVDAASEYDLRGFLARAPTRSPIAPTNSWADRPPASWRAASRWYAPRSCRITASAGA